MSSAPAGPSDAAPLKSAVTAAVVPAAMPAVRPAGKLVQLVFQGECLAGHDPLRVRLAVGKALHLDAARTVRLFSGRRVVLRKDVDWATAQRQIERFAAMGALLHAEPAGAKAASVVAEQVAVVAATMPAPPAAPKRRWRRWRWSRRRLTLAALAALATLAVLGALWWFFGQSLLVRFNLKPVVVGSGHAADPVKPGAQTAAAPRAAASMGSLAVPASVDTAQEWPQNFSAAARQEFLTRYQAAPAHKAFAVSDSGTHAWRGGLASDALAREAALAWCLRQQWPADSACRVVHAEGDWLE